ncbi:MAG: hypothetical protein ABIK89_13450, partial [Planctomycetota bacterium]
MNDYLFRRLDPWRAMLVAIAVAFLASETARGDASGIEQQPGRQQVQVMSPTLLQQAQPSVKPKPEVQGAQLAPKTPTAKPPAGSSAPSGSVARPLPADREALRPPATSRPPRPKPPLLAPLMPARTPAHVIPRPPAASSGRGPRNPVAVLKYRPAELPNRNPRPARVPLEKATTIPQVPNSTRTDSATDPDLICWVEVTSYKDPATGKPKAVSFLDEGRVRVMVKNASLTLSGPCKVAMVRFSETSGGNKQAVLPNKSVAQQAIAGTAVLPGTGSAGSKTAWLATGDVPPLKPGEFQPIWITLPAGERAAIGEGLSQGWYRVMVDTGGDIKEGTSAHSPGETNNWSGGFYVKEGPCIEDFQVENSALLPGEPLRFWASVHGSGRWALEYDYPNSTLPKTLFDKDPVMLKPFPFLNKGAYVKLPWLPWPEGGPQLQFPKMTLTLVAWNSTGSRKDSRQLAISLYEFDGKFQIVDANCDYNKTTKKVDQVWVKLSSNCDKDMKIGLFGEPVYGSVYVKCTILNPKGMVEVDDCPNCNSKTMGWYVEGETVSQGVYCADPNVAKAPSNKPLSVYSLAEGKTGNFALWKSGPLPAKGTIGLTLAPTCAKPVVGMTHGTK